jgi:hypothetical protein
VNKRVNTDVLVLAGKIPKSSVVGDPQKKLKKVKKKLTKVKRNRNTMMWSYF